MANAGQAEIKIDYQPKAVSKIAYDEQFEKVGLSKTVAVEFW